MSKTYRHRNWDLPLPLRDSAILFPIPLQAGNRHRNVLSTHMQAPMCPYLASEKWTGREKRSQCRTENSVILNSRPGRVPQCSEPDWLVLLLSFRRSFVRAPGYSLRTLDSNHLYVWMSKTEDHRLITALFSRQSSSSRLPDQDVLVWTAMISHHQNLQTVTSTQQQE